MTATAAENIRRVLMPSWVVSCDGDDDGRQRIQAFSLIAQDGRLVQLERDVNNIFLLQQLLIIQINDNV